MTFLERYEAGDRVAVWDEMNALGDAVFARKIRDDARAVAMETMRRARVNLQMLDAFRPPSKRTPDTLKALEKKLKGKLPLSLHAWWLQIGESTHHSLTVFPLDPSSIHISDPPFFPPKGAWQTSIEAWRRSLRAEGLSAAETEAKLQHAIDEFQAQDAENDVLRAIPFDPRPRHPLSPDDLARKGIKEGTFDVLLPQPAADFPLHGAPAGTLFVPWLRHFFLSVSDTPLLPL